MNATLTGSNTSINYSFNLQYEGQNYDVIVYLNEKGKFIDEIISLNGHELEYEGTEGQLREDITDYLDNNWDTLVKQ